MSRGGRKSLRLVHAKTLRQNLKVLLMVAALCLIGCGRPPESGHVEDEAMLAGRTAESFPAAGEDYFHDMDGGIALTPHEVKGRNMWLVWTGGNDRFWDKMTNASVGNFDLLKTISSNSVLKNKRDNRWDYLGLINEPCF